MTPLEERNLVWNLLELIIEKHNLKIEMESLNQSNENNIKFGNFVKGNHMDFTNNFEQIIIELQKKLPSDYKITNDKIFGTSQGHIDISKIF